LGSGPIPDIKVNNNNNNGRNRYGGPNNNNNGGSNNIAIGFAAAEELVTGSNNIDIGNRGVADERNPRD
jgi:hypothetical protein